MAGYTIGVDFGSLSGRALLIDLETGDELATEVFAYPHGVMERTLPDGTPLAADWVLQHPQDYLDVLKHTLPAVVQRAGIDSADVVGIGIDCTACTILPVTADGTPLCFLKEYRNEPHAYIKMWKHHAAQPQADRATEIALQLEEPWLPKFGGKVSSEGAIPKVLQVLEEAPHIYARAERFMEIGDWIVWQMTGRLTKNACAAGYKEMWQLPFGHPSPHYFAALNPGFAAVKEKLGTEVLPQGTCAGGLTNAFAAAVGLAAGTAVAVANVDAHVCVPAAGIHGSGKMLAIIGTSICHMMLAEEEKPVPGICGVVKDGILPGYYGYEAGQSCVGDLFSWFVETCMPAAYHAEAKRKGLDAHALLRQKAERKKPGETGLIALDWWNGNRSILVDSDLSGMLLGMDLSTKPEDIYRALIEATAFGTRTLIENYRSHGLPVTDFYASGGIAWKDPMLMQIYADVLNMPVRVVGTLQGPAYGSAMYGAVAAQCGYTNIQQAAERLGKLKDTQYDPNPAHVSVYNELYAAYQTLHDYFGRGANDVMKQLRMHKKQAASV